MQHAARRRKRLPAALVLALLSAGCATGTDGVAQGDETEDPGSGGAGGSPTGAGGAITGGTASTSSSTSASVGASAGPTSGSGCGAPHPMGPCPSGVRGAIPAGATGFTSPQDMLAYVNQSRQTYTSHTPCEGYPWSCENAAGMTWDVVMQWDDQLAAQAQSEADALAGGASPQGQSFKYQN